jgi:predicted P-loop ATPase
LQSQTGNRRFWPLTVGRVDIEALRRDRLLLLGEAAACETKEESLVLDEALWPAAAAAQEERRASDSWEQILADIQSGVAANVLYGRTIIHRDGDEERVASADLLEYVLGVLPERQTQAHSMRLANAMKHTDWERPASGKITIGGRQLRGYFRRVREN